MGVDLLPHQQEDVDWLLSRGNGVLGHEVGGGKTFPAIVAARKVGGKTLVLCPLTLAGQWSDSILRVDPTLRVQMIHADAAGKKYSPAARKAVLSSPGTWDVLIANYEIVPNVRDLLAAIGWGAVVCDEAHRLKGYRGQRSRSGGSQSKAVFSFIDRARLRVGLTGTPILNGPEDAFGVMRVCGPHVFGDSLWAFQNEFFYDVSKDRNYKILRLRPDKRAEFENRVNGNMRRLTKRALMEKYPDLLRFPDDPVVRYEVELPTALRLPYKTLEAAGFAEIDGEVIERRHILGRLMALQMLASGAMCETRDVLRAVDDGGEPVLEQVRTAKIIDMSHKFSVIEQVAEQVPTEQPLVVWAHFRHEIAAVVAWLGSRYPGQGVREVHGGVTGPARDAAIAEWKSGAVRWLVCQPASAGEGLNLQQAGHDIYLSRSHSLKDWEQARGRLPRMTSVFDTVTHHVIVTRGTVDEVIHKALLSKRALASSITRDDLLVR